MFEKSTILILLTRCIIQTIMQSKFFSYFLKMRHDIILPNIQWNWGEYMTKFDINEGKDLMHLHDNFKEFSEIFISQKRRVFEGKFAINVPCSLCQEAL